MAFAGQDSPQENAPISFPNWKSALVAANLPEVVRSGFGREVIDFLRHCKKRRAPASIAGAKAFLVSRPECRDALRWWFRAARDQPAGGPIETPIRTSHPIGTRALPAPAISDQGGADWERDLITAVRRRGFLWRTERTYREWAVAACTDGPHARRVPAIVHPDVRHQPVDGGAHVRLRLAVDGITTPSDPSSR